MAREGSSSAGFGSTGSGGTGSGGTGPRGTADLENAAELALTSFCWWRADLPREVCETYWRDVHGTMFARAPGLWQYRQLRLGPPRQGLWPEVPGIAFDAPDAPRPQGIPHGLFLSEADLRAFGEHPLPSRVIPEDARNFIGRIGALLAPTGSGGTLVDRLGEPTPQGAPPVPTFAVCLAAHEEAPVNEVHRALVDVAREWSRHPAVLRLRVEPLPPYERSAMSSPGVPWQWPTDTAYLGWIELAVRTETVPTDLATGGSLADAARVIREVHTYPIREVYTLISAGRPTDVGLRGYPAARTISDVGAANQSDDDVLTLLYGDAVRGIDQLRS
ncbi:hypothetical protein FHS23_003779 [Prauserella isguenensis]|uniref:Ethyl tert-butyl ether degradation protein EthD n=1 Tax=Prauserella isguenensis TaxID=1470180 RepID=A0A839S4T3_9PSEU|nr:ethyl tert-butyl ether degradation protein EthD [Prauserella isguenensis]MBB3052738.1 hypothetical protein [Prauserella isguenensis]